jgi:hypothetical protein
MITDYRKSIAAFIFVACVSAPTLGSSPQRDEPSNYGLCAELPWPVLESQSVSNLPREMVLSATSAGSYGWASGQLLHPARALCLAREAESGTGVLFRACDSNDQMQIWQWKSQGLTRSLVTLSVLQHQSTGHVLELSHVDGLGSGLEMVEYRVGSDAQRFAIGVCNS